LALAGSAFAQHSHAGGAAHPAAGGSRHASHAPVAFHPTTVVPGGVGFQAGPTIVAGGGYAAGPALSASSPFEAGAGQNAAGPLLARHELRGGLFAPILVEPGAPSWWWNARTGSWYPRPAAGAGGGHGQNNSLNVSQAGTSPSGPAEFAAAPPASEAIPPLEEPPPAAAPGQVEVLLPDANGLLWFDGRRMKATGDVRQFTTPPLEPGREYFYDVLAAWHDKGRLVTDHRRVPVSAGGTTIIDFTRQGNPGGAPATGLAQAAPPR
jgi:uncharacterized protein (TIGR03000 family)